MRCQYNRSAHRDVVVLVTASDSASPRFAARVESSRTPNITEFDLWRIDDGLTRDHLQVQVICDEVVVVCFSGNSVASLKRRPGELNNLTNLLNCGMRTTQLRIASHHRHAPLLVLTSSIAARCDILMVVGSSHPGHIVYCVPTEYLTSSFVCKCHTPL